LPNKKENAMAWIVTTCKKMTLVLVLLTFLAIAGCEGTETREQVDETVKELSGKKSVEQMDQMKKDLDKLKKQQADRLKKITDSAENK